MVEAVNTINRAANQIVDDPEIATRTAQYKMALQGGSGRRAAGSKGASCTARPISSATARSRMWWKSTTCNATMLRLLGIDHKRLAYRFQGHDFRLIDVRGEAVKKMLF